MSRNGHSCEKVLENEQLLAEEEHLLSCFIKCIPIRAPTLPYRESFLNLSKFQAELFAFCRLLISNPSPERMCWFCGQCFNESWLWWLSSVRGSEMRKKRSHFAVTPRDCAFFCSSSADFPSKIWYWEDIYCIGKVAPFCWPHIKGGVHQEHRILIWYKKKV